LLGSVVVEQPEFALSYAPKQNPGK